MSAASFKGRHAIKCTQQLAFLKFWERHRAADKLPSLHVLANEELRRLADKLMLCEVVGQNGDMRFLTRLHGRQFDKVHGASLVGRFVDETAPPAFRADTLSRYREVALTGQPNFGAVLLRDGSGPVVSYERLLLPFTASGSAVDYICCIVTMVTDDNGFRFDIALNGEVHVPAGGRLLSADEPSLAG